MKILYENILESGTVTVSSEDSNFPKYRLYDKDISQLFKFTSTDTSWIKADAGSAVNIDTLIIPEGHNLAGLSCALKYSDDDTTYNTIDSFTAGSGLISREFSSAQHRYWKFEITNPGKVVYMAELFLGKSVILTRKPSRTSEYLPHVKNILRLEHLSGRVTFLRKGKPRRRYNYTFRFAKPELYDQFINLEEKLYAVPGFWLLDHLGNWVWVELLENLSIYLSGITENFTVTLQELI